MVINVALLLGLAAGVVMNRRPLLPKVDDPEVAFGLLESSVKRAFPDLKDSFTWREAVGRARRAGAAVDWSKIMSELEEYEAYKYGGKEKPAVGVAEVVRLALALRIGGGKIARP